MPMRHIVNALLVRRESVLLVRRAPHRVPYPELWSFPGGQLEPNENLTDGVLREIREEIGISPTSFSFLGTILDPNAPDTDPATYYFYKVTKWDGGEPALLGDEHTDLQWLTPSVAAALPELALEEYRPLLNRVAS